MSALKQYNADMACLGEHDPIERLRFFLSFALVGQDWLDVEQFIDGVSEQLAKKDAEIAMLRTGDTCARQCEGTDHDKASHRAASA